MKASTLIAKLAHSIEEFGDKEVPVIVDKDIYGKHLCIIRDVQQDIEGNIIIIVGE